MTVDCGQSALIAESQASSLVATDRARLGECSRVSPERLGPSLRYGPMLLAWNSKFGPRARWSDSSHSREPMDVNAATRYEVIGDGPPLLMYSPGGFDGTVEKWSTQGVYARIKLLDHLPKKYAASCSTGARPASPAAGSRCSPGQRYVAQGKELLEHLGIARVHLHGRLHGRVARWWRSRWEYPEMVGEPGAVLAGRRREVPHQQPSALPDHLDYAEGHSLAEAAAHAGLERQDVRRGSARRALGLGAAAGPARSRRRSPRLIGRNTNASSPTPAARSSTATPRPAPSPRT